MSSNEAKEFREETRAWLADNCPEGARGPGQTPWGSSKIVLDRDSALWLERMAERGWTVPTWPKTYGGAGLDKDLYPILIEELKRIGARTPLTGRGVNYIGPTILELGSEDQRQRWLPGIARGEGGWAMGYSEPGAGSDLASLACRGELIGDQYQLNGRKVWTSDAMHCDYIFVLIRTDTNAPRHEGISLILVDMDQPGVEVSPIRLISGESPFCETVFKDALRLRTTSSAALIKAGRSVNACCSTNVPPMLASTPLALRAVVPSPVRYRIWSSVIARTTPDALTIRPCAAPVGSSAGI